MVARLRTLGIIPARGGSKRIPKKNLRLLNGYPLIRYTIRAAKEASLLTDWVVSTEDNEIANLALSYGAYVVKRPDSLAEDDSTSGAVARHALGWMEVDREPYDIVVLLHPTSPVRDPKHIDQAIRLLRDSDAPALASVSCRKRTYTHNASIYAMRSDWLVKTEQHYCDQSIPFLMDARHSVDIDTEEDFKIAELFVNG
jgi:CMP-N,N'-diacetyllegionaminic acid synthase